MTRPMLSPAQKVAMKLVELERELANWHDFADSPHADINLILKHVIGIRQLVQGHVIADSEIVEKLLSGWNEPDSSLIDPI